MDIEWLFTGRDRTVYGLRKDTEHRIFTHLTKESQTVTRRTAPHQCVWYRHQRSKTDQYTIRRQKKYRVHVAVVLYQLFHGRVLARGGHRAEFSHTCRGRQDEPPHNHLVCVNPWHVRVVEEDARELPILGKRARSSPIQDYRHSVVLEKNTSESESESEEDEDEGEDECEDANADPQSRLRVLRKRRQRKRMGIYNAARHDRQHHFWDKVLSATCTQPEIVGEAYAARRTNIQREQEAFRTLDDFRYGQTHLARMLAPPRHILGIDTETEKRVIREMQTRSAELEDMSPEKLLFYIPPAVEGTYVFQRRDIATMRTFLENQGINTVERRQDAMRSFISRRTRLPVPHAFHEYTHAELQAMTGEERQRVEDDQFVQYPLGTQQSYDQIRGQCLPPPTKKVRTKPTKHVRFAL